MSRAAAPQLARRLSGAAGGAVPGQAAHGAGRPGQVVQVLQGSGSVAR